MNFGFTFRLVHHNDGEIIRKVRNQLCDDSRAVCSQAYRVCTGTDRSQNEGKIDVKHIEILDKVAP